MAAGGWLAESACGKLDGPAIGRETFLSEGLEVVSVLFAGCLRTEGALTPDVFAESDN